MGGFAWTNNPAGYLVSAVSAQTTGAPMDTRNAWNFGYLLYIGSGNGGAAGSSVFNFEVSHDSTGWMVDSTYTATATQTGSATLSKFFPYVRANVTKTYSGGGGSGCVWVHYSPGVG